MANEGSTRLTTAQLRAMIGTAGKETGISYDKVPVSGSTIASTTNSAQIAHLERLQRMAKTAAFRLAQTQTAREKSIQEKEQLVLERSTTNSIANANVQNGRVEVVNSRIINYPTSKPLDDFADRKSFLVKPQLPNYVIHGVDQNTPFVNSLVNFSGIGTYGNVQASKPTTSTSTQQNNSNNSVTTPVNKTNLIPDVNFQGGINITALDQLADRKSIVGKKSKKSDSNFNQPSREVMDSELKKDKNSNLIPITVGIGAIAAALLMMKR